MASIVSAQIMGIREAHNTIGTTTYNSTNYSVLVYYSDGSTDIVEGDASSVKYLMRYVPRTDSAEKLEQMLTAHEQNIKSMIDKEIIKVFDALKPVPDIVNKPELSSITLLKDNGFVVNLLNKYPTDIPEGYVYAVERKTDAPMCVDVDIRHKMPQVTGKSENEGLQILKDAGFITTVVYNYDSSFSENIISAVNRASETKLDVKVTVNSNVPNVFGATEQEAKAILEAAGFSPIFTHTMSEEYPYGTVFEAIAQSNRSVNVRISDGANQLVARNVNVSANTLPDSSNDEYTASAWVVRNEHTLYVQLDLRSSCKKPHTITGRGTANTSFGKNADITVRPLKPVYEINSNDLTQMKLIIPVSDDQLMPADIQATIATTHGLMKSKFDIELSIHIDW